MQTYTVRALNIGEAELVKTAAERLNEYDTRHGLTQENSLSGEWDMRQGARLAEQLRIALQIIERITRTQETARVCRTCGFTDCPGASGGACPRWPA